MRNLILRKQMQILNTDFVVISPTKTPQPQMQDLCLLPRFGPPALFHLLRELVERPAKNLLMLLNLWGVMRAPLPLVPCRYLGLQPLDVGQAPTFNLLQELFLHQEISNCLPYRLSLTKIWRTRTLSNIFLTENNLYNNARI
jgi:hypothetical protein